MILVPTVSAEVPGEVDDFFLACSSFEEQRCLAAAEHLVDYRSKACIVVNFTASSTAEGELRKRRTAQELCRRLKPFDVLGVPRLLNVAPYAYSEMISKLFEELRRRDIDANRLRATIDISCLTKVQLLFLVAGLILGAHVERIRFLYVVPVSYNSTRGDKFSRLGIGSFKPVVLPLRRWSGHGASTTRRGALVLLGHEGHRTLAALRRVDPDEVLLVEAKSGDEDLEATCRKENEYLFDMTIDRHNHKQILRVERVDISGAMYSISQWLTSYCGDPRAVVSLVPLGPKPLVIAAALACLARPDLTSEVVYPMASKYNPNYSEGVKCIYQGSAWFQEGSFVPSFLRPRAEE